MPLETPTNGTPASPDSGQNSPNQSPTTSTSNLSSNENQAGQEEQAARVPTVADALAAFEAEESGTSASQQSADNPSAILGSSQQSASPGKGLNSKRIYDGLDDEEKQYFDRMSTQAYNYLYPRHLKSKEYENKLKELESSNKQLQEFSLYDQEGAWKISPEYDQYVQAGQRLGGEIEYWKQQLANAEAGNKVRMLEYDEKGVFLGAEVDPTPAVKADIIAALNQGFSLQRDFSNKLQQFEQGFKTKHTSYLTEMAQTRDKVLQGVDKVKLEQVSKKKLEMFPSYVRHKPEVKLVAELLTIVEGLLKMAAQQKQTVATNGIKQNIARNAGPTADRIQAGSPGTPTVKNAMDDFRTMRAKGLA